MLVALALRDPPEELRCVDELEDRVAANRIEDDSVTEETRKVPLRELLDSETVVEVEVDVLVAGLKLLLPLDELGGP